MLGVERGDERVFPDQRVVVAPALDDELRPFLGGNCWSQRGDREGDSRSGRTDDAKALHKAMLKAKGPAHKKFQKEDDDH